MMSLSLIYALPSSAFAATTSDAAFCAVSVPGYTTERLTNNHRYNTSLIPLENGHAVWLELQEGGAGPGKLIYFDGRSQRVLTENADTDNGRGGIAAAGSNKVAWEENTGGGRLDIFFFDGARIARLTSPDGDVTNRGVSVDASGKVAWVRTISDPTNGSSPTQAYGESRVMLWDGVSARAISEANRSASNSGIFYRTTFSNGALTWIAIEAAQAHSNQGEDRYSAYLYRDGTLRSHVLSDLPAGNYFFNYTLTDTDVVYQPKTTSDTDAGLYRSYNWATDTTTDIARFSPGSDASFVSRANRFGSTVFSPSKTYLWTGSELREPSRLKPSQYNGLLSTSDIKSDGSSVLYGAYTNNSPVLSQIFKYDVASNTLSQFTNTSGSRGAAHAWFGSNGEMYWNVYSSDTYQSTDICVARLSSSSTSISSAPASKQVPNQPSTTTETACAEETVSDYIKTMDEAGQALKSSVLVSFDVQAGYRLRAALNKNRIKTVRTALTDARKTLETSLNALLIEQHKASETQSKDLKKDSPKAISFTSLDTAWNTMNRTLLAYASASDKKVINRILAQKKAEIINKYKTSQSETYANAKSIVNICSMQNE